MTRRKLSEDEWNRIEAKLDQMFGPLHEYEAEATWVGGSMSVPIFGTDDASALKTFDAVLMLWHHNRRLYPTSLFEASYCPDATELVLWAPGRIELARFSLARQ